MVLCKIESFSCFLLICKKNMNLLLTFVVLQFALLQFFATGFRSLPSFRRSLTPLYDSCVIEWDQGEVSWDLDDDVQPIIRNYVPPLSNDYLDGECKMVESSNISYVVCSSEVNNTVSFQIEGNIDKMYIDAVRSTLNNGEGFSTDVLSNYEVFMEENPEFTIMLLAVSTYAKFMKVEDGLESQLMTLQKIVRGVLITIVLLLKGAKGTM